jgi:hypothetical protein
MAGLLNPAVEASVCREMIQKISQQLEQVERQLTHTPLDMNAYHTTFGRAAALRAALADLTTIYNQNFNV